MASFSLFYPLWSVVLLSALLCLVVAVSDGDTLTARCGPTGASPPMQVRIAAIDAPERRQAYGHSARQQLVQLCLQRRAHIEPLGTDSYGRTVANVRCGQTDVATEQVRLGLAWVAPSYAKAHPHLAPLQQQARQDKRGLWAQRRPLAPWAYRHRYPR